MARAREGLVQASEREDGGSEGKHECLGYRVSWPRDYAWKTCQEGPWLFCIHSCQERVLVDPE